MTMAMAPSPVSCSRNLSAKALWRLSARRTMDQSPRSSWTDDRTIEGEFLARLFISKLERRNPAHAPGGGVMQTRKPLRAILERILAEPRPPGEGVGAGLEHPAMRRLVGTVRIDRQAPAITKPISRM